MARDTARERARDTAREPRVPRPAPRRNEGYGRLDQPMETRRSLVPRPSFDPDVFGRFAETFARFMGTARFLLYMTVFVLVWLAWNTFLPPSWQFDPRSLNYTLLTLILSLQASYAAPLILLAQNRQADRDRVQYEQDRARAERSVADTEYLTREVAALRIALGDVATRDFLRSELRTLLEEIDDRARQAALEAQAEPAGREDTADDDGNGGSGSHAAGDETPHPQRTAS